jgi:hypothetical protein
VVLVLWILLDFIREKTILYLANYRVAKARAYEPANPSKYGSLARYNQPDKIKMAKT